MRKLHKSLAVSLIALVLTLTLVFSILPALAGDVLIKAEVESVTKAVDRNGNEYIRFIVNETRKLSGVEYTAGVAVMAFGEHAKKLTEVSEGDLLNVICSQREFKGRTSYTILKVLE